MSFLWPLLFGARLFVPSSMAQDLTLAPLTHVVTVSPDKGHYSEPSIAINPRNPEQVVVVFQGGRRVQGSATAAYSVDGGATFHLAAGTKAQDWKVLGDVTTTFDLAGHVYLCSIAFDKLGATSYWARGAGRNGIVVRRSDNGGKTWNAAISNVKTFQTGKERDIQFEDEPRIFADNNPSSPNVGNLYVGWVEWQLTQSVMLFSRSTDGAKTWSEPLRISTVAGLPRDDNGGLGGYSQATGRDGRIFAAWSNGTSVVLASSRDGGRTFSPSRPVIGTGPAYFGEVPGIARVTGFPVIGVDARKGHENRLYVSWSDYSNGDVDVFIAASADAGKTWSGRVRVNNDPLHNGIDQFFHWMSVDPISGTIFLDFYDRRADSKNSNVRLTLARSTDAGRTFQNLALTTAAFRPLGAFLGDYTGIDAYDNHVAVAWTETAKRASHSNKETVIKTASVVF